MGNWYKRCKWEICWCVCGINQSCQQIADLQQGDNPVHSTLAQKQLQAANQTLSDWSNASSHRRQQKIYHEKSEPTWAPGQESVRIYLLLTLWLALVLFSSDSLEKSHWIKEQVEAMRPITYSQSHLLYSVFCKRPCSAVNSTFLFKGTPVLVSLDFTGNCKWNVMCWHLSFNFLHCFTFPAADSHIITPRHSLMR